MKYNYFKKAVSCVLSATLLLTATAFASPASAADEFAGYTWSATEGYMESTTSVDYSDNKLVIGFAGVDNTENFAGICTKDGSSIDADWSAMDEINFTITNPNSFDVDFTFALCTGESWDWYQNYNYTINANSSSDIELHLKNADWAWEGSEWVNNVPVDNLLYVKRINLAVSSSDSTPRTGSITLSDWSIEEGSGSQDTGNGKITSEGGFYVNGNTLYDANNNPFVMRGINYAFTWFKGSESRVIPKIAEYGCNTVRIVLSNGMQWEKNTASEVANLIRLCEENDLIAVLEVHDPTGMDDQASLEAAARYFAELKTTLEGHEASVIINIANEWQGSTNPSAWNTAYKSAVKIIRDVGLTHCIMVDAGGWGQGASTVHQYGTEVLASDPETNIIFSIHMYGTAGGSPSVIKNNIDGALNKNLALCIGEFGFNHTDGDVDEEYIMSYCQEKGVGWLAWSWYGNSSQVAYLDLVSDPDGNTLTSWGEIVFNGPNGTKDTSEICSVFTTTGDDDDDDDDVAYDVNGDGVFDIKDFSKLIKYIVGMISVDEIDFDAADATGDGDVNIADAVIIIRALAAA